MIKNNLLMLLIQVVLSFFWMGFVLLVSTSPSLGQIFYGNWVAKLTLIGLIALVYYLLAKILKKNLGLVKIIFSGLLPFLVGLGLFALAYLGEGEGLLDGAVASSLWRFPMDLYLLPQMYTVHLLGLAKTWLGYGVALSIGTIIMEVSLLLSYLKFRRRKRKRGRS